MSAGDYQREGKELMSKMTRALGLASLVLVGCMLSGCPGMPGMPGAGGGGEQKMPPGVLPPPGLESGGARTLMGATVTSPDNAFLLVSYSSTVAGAQQAAQWDTCRRILPLEGCVIVEGLNYDGRIKGAPQDVNRLVPYQGLTSFQWKYEAKPAPPEAPVEKPGTKPGAKPQGPKEGGQGT